MGFEQHNTKHQFGLHELGVLEGPPLRGAQTIVETVAELINVPHAAFLVFDDAAGCARVRISSTQPNTLLDVPLAESLCNWIRDEDKTLAVSSIKVETPGAPELQFLGAAAFLGTPVQGPGSEAIGVLAAIHSAPREWNGAAVKKIEDLAHLISQEIMLRASFETLRIMSTERVQQFS